ncbi:hypothetical protein FSARC_7469 [Fusarium sarcochroum]|uniref:asparaginase n=1 Tax=Fusarium sarcochroum TaxID=1208366 RepID=A0A8H4TV95_9HYPO|nr:hypothetical protein FSARC_7469 [Fusarium sarcochroum]
MHHHTQATKSLNDDDEYLPKVALIATGGTIGGRGDSPTDTTHYEAGALDIDVVTYDVKKSWRKFANVVMNQELWLDSIDLDPTGLIALNHKVMKELRRLDATTLVLTGGTSAMYLWATNLAHTIPSNYRVVLTGAIKPHTAYGAEGPGNILAAIKTATTPGWSGVVILMNNKIMLPHGTLKKKNCFEPGPGSLLGDVTNFGPRLRCYPRRVAKHIDISGLSPEEPLPRVETIPVSPGCDAKAIKSAIEREVKGIILEGFDDGYWPKNSRNEITQWANNSDVIIVMTSRHLLFSVDEERVPGVLPGGDWISDQLQTILQLLIKLRYSKEEIREFILDPFEITQA